MRKARNVSRGTQILVNRPVTERQARRLATARRLLGDLALVEKIRAEAVPRKRPLREWVDAFLTEKRTKNCTQQTIETYTKHLARFEKSGFKLDALDVRKHLASLQSTMKPISVHKHYRTIRSFLSWGERNSMIVRPEDNPLYGFSMIRPRVEKQAPTDADVRALLAACDVRRYEGRRNKALVSLLSDAGLRISEALRLRWRDVHWSEHTLQVMGKGQKEEPSPFGNTAAAALRVWRATQSPESADSYVFTDRAGRPLLSGWGTHLMHRLSRKAGLKALIGPHALRRYMACSLLKRSKNLELCRKTLRHSTLAMTLQYAKLSGTDVTREFIANSPLDNLRAGS